MNFNPVGRWEKGYTTMTEPKCYGDEEGYVEAAAWLDDLDTVEDWGCGGAYARRFFKHASYLGIDGSKSPLNDITEDLLKRDSKPDGILMRHVLEHNLRWKRLLTNAHKCAQKRLLVVMFTDWGPATIYPTDPDGIPCIEFQATEFFQVIGPPDKLLRVKHDTLLMWKK